MRIALVAEEEPGWGGIGTYTGVMGGALRGLGHDVHLVLRGWDGDSVTSADGLTVHKERRSSWRTADRATVPEPSWRAGTVAATCRLFTARESLIFSARAAGVLAAVRPDVTEGPEFHAPALIPAARKRIRGAGGPVVVRLHTPGYLTAELAGERRDADGRAGEVLEALGAHCATALTSPTRALADAVSTRWRLSGARLSVIPNPIDEALFTPLREDLENPDSILIVGRVERAKGQDLMIEALPAIRAAVPAEMSEFYRDAIR